MTINPVILMLALGQTLVWAGAYYVFPALLLHWESAMGWSRADITLALMLATFSMAMASPVAGRLIDQGKGPLVMGSSTVMAGICIGLLATVNSLWLFYILWIVNGAMLAGCLYEPCFALITRVRGGDAKRSITAVTLIAGFASSLSFPAAHILSTRFSWQTTVLVFATVVITLAAPLLWVGARKLERQYESPDNNQETGSGSAALPKKKQSESTASSDFLRRPVFWFLGCGFAFAAIVHGAALQHLLPILDERGMAAGIAVTAVSLIGPMQVSGRILIALLGDRLSNHATVLLVFAAMAASIVCLIGARWQPWMLFAFVLLFGGGYGVLSIIRPVIARELLGGHAFGAKTGVLAFMYLIGAGSSAWIGSLLWRLGGYTVVLSLLVAMIVLATALYMKAYRNSDSNNADS